jgi:hypothetical protein
MNAEKAARNCRKKKKYGSEEKARMFGWGRVAKGGGNLWPYLCPVCSDWHLTSQANERKPITYASSGLFR